MLHPLMVAVPAKKERRQKLFCSLPLIADLFSFITSLFKYPYYEKSASQEDPSHMSKKYRSKKTYEYSCTITGETFKTTREAPHPNELISVKAYYELHPEDEDRPEVVTKQLQIAEEEAQELAESLATLELAKTTAAATNKDKAEIPKTTRRV